MHVISINFRIEEEMRKRKGLNFYRRKKKINRNILIEVFTWSFGIVAMILLAYTTVYCVGMKTSVIGISMEDTLYNGQNILINRFIYNISQPKAGDVIVFLPNGNSKSHYYVKRIIAQPDDRIQIINGRVHINGILHEDDFDKIADPGMAAHEILLGDDEYFVLGDNRNDSEDSRSGNLGAIHKSNIVGKAWFKLNEGSSKMGFIK